MRERKREPLEILQPGERSPFWDKILRLRTSNPAAFNVLSPGVRLSAGVYEASLRRDAEIEAMKRDTSTPAREVQT